MNGRIRLGALAAVTALSLVATPMQARAIAPGLAVGMAVFSGKMQVGVPICDVPSSALGVCGPKKGVVQPFVLDAGPNVCCANGTPSACVGAVAHPKKTPGATLSVPPLGHCDITATGLVAPGPPGVGPWCINWWTGFGVAGTIDYNKGKTFAFAGGFWPAMVGKVIVILAVGPGGKPGKPGIVGSLTVMIIHVMEDIPFKGESCAQWLGALGATDFWVFGAAVFVAV